MSFNPDLQKSTYPTLSFNNNTVTHLGMFLDTKLDFQGHLKKVYSIRSIEQ